MNYIKKFFKVGDRFLNIIDCEIEIKSIDYNKDVIWYLYPDATETKSTIRYLTNAVNLYKSYKYLGNIKNKLKIINYKFLNDK